MRSHRAAVAATPPGDIDRAGYLSGLGFALRVLLERSGDAGLLAEAVQVAGDAVAATPPGHPSLAARLTNLGTALQARFLNPRTRAFPPIPRLSTQGWGEIPNLGISCDSC